MAFSANCIYCYIEQEKRIQMNLFLKIFINNCQRGAGVNIIHLAVGGDINYSYRVYVYIGSTRRRMRHC